MDSCGTVDLVEASETRGPGFDYSNQQEKGIWFIQKFSLTFDCSWRLVTMHQKKTIQNFGKKHFCFIKHYNITEHQIIVCKLVEHMILKLTHVQVKKYHNKEDQHFTQKILSTAMCSAFTTKRRWSSLSLRHFSWRRVSTSATRSTASSTACPAASWTPTAGSTPPTPSRQDGPERKDMLYPILVIHTSMVRFG